MGKSWKMKLPDALWAYRTAYKTLLDMSTYQLVYGKTCHLPVKLEHRAHWSIRKFNMNFQKAGLHRKQQLSELEEWRDKAYHSAKIYKEKTKKWHDKRIKQKEFKPGDKILLFNSRIKLFGHWKHWSKWEGPYSIIEATPLGTITLQDDGGKTFKVNGHRLKIFLEPDNKEYDVIIFIEET